MTSSHRSAVGGGARRGGIRIQVLRLLAAGLLGLAAAALISCGASSRGLIPASDAGPLQSDFETVQQAAENGEGSCSTTEAALVKTGEDLSALPRTVDAGLRNNLRQGVANLRTRALALCAQPLIQTATTSEPKSTTTTSTNPTTSTPATTQTTSTQTTPTGTASTPTTTSPGGGTPAPGAGEPPAGAGSGQGGGTGVGESPNAGAGGAGAGELGPAGQEGGK